MMDMETRTAIAKIAGYLRAVVTMGLMDDIPESKAGAVAALAKYDAYLSPEKAAA